MIPLNRGASPDGYVATATGFAYDANGNMTANGLRGMTYDDENELVGVMMTNFWWVTYAYDGLQRRRIERDYTWVAGSWQEKSEIHYIYDGNLVFQERDQNNRTLTTYTRGLDLSGTLDGAGGIGGLIARSDKMAPLIVFPTDPDPQWDNTSYYHSDGNGNVTALIYPSGAVVAHYQYDPFGNLLSMNGQLANLNKYRFSSKQWDATAELYYYGHRFYDPNLQRWLNRDPIQEWGGINLYGFLENNPIRYIDALGWCAQFTFNDGTTESAVTAQQFETIANNAKPNSIKNITITGHAGPDDSGGASSQFLDTSLNSGELTSGRGGVILDDPTVSNLKTPDPTLSGLLNGKLASGATINLNGCKSGAPGDPNNIAKQVSKDLKNVPVTGQDNNYHVIWPTTIHSPFFHQPTTTYINGSPQ